MLDVAAAVARFAIEFVTVCGISAGIFALWMLWMCAASAAFDSTAHPRDNRNSYVGYRKGKV